MNITARHIPDYVWREPFETIPVRDMQGNLAYNATMQRACVLIEAECVEGFGSKAHLRYLKLIVAPEEVEKRTAGGVKAASDNLRLTVGERRDALMKMISSQKTIYRERIPDRNVSGKFYLVFAHRRRGYAR